MNFGFWSCVMLVAASVGPPVHFDTEVIPVLTKAGCNSGACHGAAAGRGEFHLSLLGSDPAADYDEIVREFEGRRVNLHRPELSLLLAKPTGQLEHGGDIVLSLSENAGDRLLQWIRSGAPRGAPRKLTAFRLTPARHLFTAESELLPLRAIARFDDGQEEDVTEWTTFTVTDPSAVSLDAQARLRALRPGMHVVIARFLDRVAPVQVLLPYGDRPLSVALAPNDGFIDQHILQTLVDLRIPPAQSATDSEFMRRASLDLTGRLPEPVTLERYATPLSAEMRAEFVDELLRSEAFVDYWTLLFGRQLHLHTLPNETEGVVAYTAWLRQQIASATPLDQVATELLTATGDAHVVGPANFGRMVGDARGQAELVGRFFMGVRLGCANCHNHPLDRWTQDDYHGLAAIFARLERGRHVRLASRGEVTNLRTAEPAVPRIPGASYLEQTDDDLRVAYAEWLVKQDSNQQFARAMVNRLWKQMFGRGLVEPADDMRETNPPTHPELLARLATDFVEHNYDLRHVLRQIVLSNTYGRSAATNNDNRSDDRFYSHAFRRRLSPEVLVDAISDVTGVPTEFSEQLLGTRAIALVNPMASAPVLDILGRCSRVADCNDTAENSVTVTASLHLLNGELINAKITHPDGRLQIMLRSGKSDDEIVQTFYRQALSRLPTDLELTDWRTRLHAADAADRAARLEDFVWALLNSREFRENH